MPGEPPFSDEQVEGAVRALEDPERLRAAQALVERHAPALARVLDAALEEGGWFGPAHDEQVVRAALDPDAEARVGRVRTLVAEETRVGMLVGVAAGYALARELQDE